MSPSPSARWSDAAIAELTSTTACPACGEATLAASRCHTCGADYSALGGELWAASLVAADALRARQAVLDRVPRLSPERAAPEAASPEIATPAIAAPGEAFARPRDPEAPPRPGEAPASATVQSVLAVAGAGLVAIAALVFTFFNPDLTDRVVRSAIVGAIAVAFLGAAFALSRRRLQFSAEAVGALGMVFLALVIGSTSDGATPASWAAPATGTLIVGAVMATIGALARIRTWLWISLLGLTAVPLMYGGATGAQSGVTVGSLGGALLAFGLIAIVARIAPRFDQALTSERIALTVAQFALVGIALISSVLTPAAGPGWWIGHSLVLGAVAVLAVLSARNPAGGLWSFVGGVAGVTAFAVLPGAVAGTVGVFLLALLPAAAAAGVIVVRGLLPLPRTVARGALQGGALLVLAAVAQPTVVATALIGGTTLLGGRLLGEDVLSGELTAAAALGLGAIAAGLVTVALLTTRRDRVRFADTDGSPRRPGTRWLGDAAGWFAASAVLVALATPALLPAAQVWAYLLAGAVGALVVALVPPVRRSRRAVRLPLIVGSHAAVVVGGILSLRDDSVIVTAGAGVVAAILILARTVPPRARFVHVGAAYAYALLVVGIALHLAGVGALPLLCLVTAVGGAGAIAATFAPFVGPRAWKAILAVTSAPFVAGVVQVVFERSGWTALSTSVIFALALTLTLTRRPGLNRQLRAVAGAILVPALAVVAVCLGAQLLAVSGSPVVLPVIAALVASVLPARLVIRGALGPRIGQKDAAATALAIEAATLLTGALTVALALGRESAGLGTTLLVLVILAVGAAATARWAGRRYGWWVAAATSTGALWCAWGLAGITLAEPYVLPPAIGAALAGAILVARGARALPLYASGLGLAVVPVLVLLAATGTPAAQEWRAYALVTAAFALCVAGVVLTRRSGRTALLAPVTLAAAVVAGAAGSVQAVRWGLGLDLAATGAPLLVLGVGMGVAGAVPAAVAGAFLRPAVASDAARRWLGAPAMLFAAASAWTTIERDWFVIWAMWALMLALLVGMLAIAVQGRGRRTALPPVWFVFALAFVTAVVAWSPRDLRVEWFSLPLGLFLIAAGAVAVRAEKPLAGRRIDDWPFGFAGSWPLLAPGIVVTLSASMASTFTDPLTWRAILVIVLALAAIVIGAARRLAAPFLLGIVALPLENVLAFLVQIGRGIESMPWWITLSVVGAVLLTIAVTYERRSGADAGIAARLRDLR